MPIDGRVTFGTLEITARACHKAPPEEPPESAAFLEVREQRRNEAPGVVFSGWMFSSSPGLSTLEHPVYDLWVVDCLLAATEPIGAESEPGGTAAPSGADAEAAE